jgi:hypothetical protein
MTRRYVIVAGVAVALAAGGVGIAQAVGGDDESEQATGPSADRARAAALREVPGRANAVERDSEGGGTWEVEIVRSSDGKQVDVRLDESYKLVGVDGDSEEKDSSESDSD